ncbi:MAG: hypothetical protein IKE90_03095 [Bacilli bacterium]|nr:hypothetical protein [Bacilli bacterium]
MNKVFGYILGFLSSIIIVLVSMFFILKITVFNKNYLIKSLETSSYYDKVYDEIGKDMKNSLRSSGLDDSVVNNLYKKSDVKSDIANLVGSIYSGSKYYPSTTEIENKLRNNIDKYLKSKNIVLEDKTILDSYISSVIEVYSKETSLYGYLQNYTSRFVKISNAIDFIIALGVILLVIIIIINKYKFKIHFLGVTFLSSSMMILYLKQFIWNKIDYENILIISKAFSDVLRIILADINKYTIYLAVIFALLGFGLIFINSWKNKRNRKLN